MGKEQIRFVYVKIQLDASQAVSLKENGKMIIMHTMVFRENHLLDFLKTTEYLL